MRLGILVRKIVLFIIIVIGDLTQVFVIFLKQPLTIVSNRKISCINLSGLDRA